MDIDNRLFLSIALTLFLSIVVIPAIQNFINGNISIGEYYQNNFKYGKTTERNAFNIVKSVSGDAMLLLEKDKEIGGNIGSAISTPSLIKKPINKAEENCLTVPKGISLTSVNYPKPLAEDDKNIRFYHLDGKRLQPLYILTSIELWGGIAVIIVGTIYLTIFFKKHFVLSKDRHQ